MNNNKTTIIQKVKNRLKDYKGYSTLSWLLYFKDLLYVGYHVTAAVIFTLPFLGNTTKFHVIFFSVLAGVMFVVDLVLKEEATDQTEVCLREIFEDIVSKELTRDFSSKTTKKLNGALIGHAYFNTRAALSFLPHVHPYKVALTASALVSLVAKIVLRQTTMNHIGTSRNNLLFVGSFAIITYFLFYFIFYFKQRILAKSLIDGANYWSTFDQFERNLTDVLEKDRLTYMLKASDYVKDKLQTTNDVFFRLNRHLKTLEARVDSFEQIYNRFVSGQFEQFSTMIMVFFNPQLAPLVWSTGAAIRTIIKMLFSYQEECLRLTADLHRVVTVLNLEE